MHCLPVLFLCNSEMYLILWVQHFTLWKTARVKLVIYGSTSGFYYMLDTAEKEGVQSQIAPSLPRFPLITHTQKHTRTDMQGHFYLPYFAMYHAHPCFWPKLSGKKIFHFNFLFQLCIYLYLDTWGGVLQRNISIYF